VTAVSVAATATRYDDTSVALNTQYYYRVRAENTNSYSVWSNTAAIKTPAGGTVPLARTNLTIGTPTRFTIPISWTNPGGPTVDNIAVQYSTRGSTGPWTTATASLPAGTTSYSITGLRNGTTYWIRVNAIIGAVTTPSAVKTGTTLR
jgi:hypothetical protein